MGFDFIICFGRTRSFASLSGRKATTGFPSHQGREIELPWMAPEKKKSVTPDRLKMKADRSKTCTEFFFTTPAFTSMPCDVVVTHQHSKRIHHPYVQQLPPEDRVREHCRPGQHLLRTKG